MLFGVFFWTWWTKKTITTFFGVCCFLHFMLVILCMLSVFLSRKPAGSQDDILQGMSTFLLEMKQVTEVFCTVHYLSGTACIVVLFSDHSFSSIRLPIC